MTSANLDGRVVVITGATGCIGQAVARELHGLGAKLVLTARSHEQLSHLQSQPGASFIAADITELDLSAHGRCDVMLNNAGVIEVGPIDGIDIDKVCHMVRVNVESTFRAAYPFVRHFLAQREGHLINISSVLGTKVRPSQAPTPEPSSPSRRCRKRCTWSWRARRWQSTSSRALS